MIEFDIRCKTKVPNESLERSISISVFCQVRSTAGLENSPQMEEAHRKKTLELHERLTRAIAESGFFLGEIKTTGL